MAEVIAYRGIPGKNNFDLAQKLLTEHDIPSRWEMEGFSFQSMPPISVNNLWVEEEHYEEASKLIEELAKDGWLVFQQRGRPGGGS